ncbi:GrpB family protein [Shewanella salipaludis]|uniref:GrpB family protein n=1 Tax=Shewanella salipaludis TaxID=2723052 RepID=UPI00245617BF|nr:GrpB family protein [Shewanella salipaludis]
MLCCAGREWHWGASLFSQRRGATQSSSPCLQAWGYLMRHRAFRDYLMAHPDVAQAYGAIKRVAAIECKNDMAAYMQHKNRFIQYHQQQAIACYGPMAGANL